MTAADPRGEVRDFTRSCYESWMRVPEYPNPIRVRWYEVPPPEPGSYELTDYCSSDFDNDPKSLDPDLGEQSSTRQPWTDWRDCSGPPFPPPPASITAAGFAFFFSPHVIWDTTLCNGVFPMNRDAYPAWSFTAARLAFITSNAFIDRPAGGTRRAVWRAVPTAKGITVTLTSDFAGAAPGVLFLLTYKGVPSPVTVPLRLTNEFASSPAWDASTVTVPGYAPSYEEDDVLIGSLVWDTGTDAIPPRYLLADGSRVSQATYALYFARVGFAFGVDLHDGSFALPDLRGRSPIGSGGDYATGQKVGSASRMLLATDLPDLTHGHAAAALGNSTGDAFVQLNDASGTDSLVPGTGPGPEVSASGSTADTGLGGTGGSQQAVSLLHPCLGCRPLIYAGV